MKITHLIVDSSAFIHHGPIKETGENIYTCEEVLDEIKDEATRNSLRFLPYELKLLQFDKEDLDQCVEFAKRTGDYQQLSVVDLKLIAATYRLERRFNGMKYINKEPKQVAVKPLEKSKSGGQAMDKLNKILDEIKLDDVTDELEDEEVEDENDEAVSSEESDDEGWITPNNIDLINKRMGISNPVNLEKATLMEDRVTVACMTSDFSMQNCLLQMGLLVVSPVDGLMIKEAKKIALRCHACFKVFHEPSKIKNKFCPHCGNLDTLKRVQYVIDKDGTKRILVNFKRPIKVKGTNQQLPRPRGGKHANNPLLAPDQKVRKDKKDKFTVQEKKTVTSDHILHDPAYLVRTNPFAYRR